MVFLLWRILIDRGIPQGALLLPLKGDWLQNYCAAAIVTAGFVFSGRGGTIIVRGLLSRYPSMATVSEDGPGAMNLRMGRVIGVLERFIVYVLVLMGQWGALGLVLAAKSVARYPEMRHENFADYYLIGTLCSLIVAMASGIVVTNLL